MSEVPRSRMGVGLAATVVGVAVLTSFAVWAPAGLRKLGLFSILFGGGAGAIVGWAAREFQIPKRLAGPLTAALIGVGLMVVAIQGARQLRLERQAASKADPKQALAMNLLQAAAEEDPDITADLERHRRWEQPTFTDYLAVRVRPLGEWNPPWPSLFWTSEIVLALIAGVIVVSRITSSSGSPTEGVTETESEQA